MPTWRVVVADDDERFRAALVQTLEGDQRFEVVASVASGEELWEAAARLHPHVVVIDVRMPSGGVEAAHGVRRHVRNGTVIVVLSAHESMAQLPGLLQAGVTGFLVKGRLGSGSLPDLVARCAAGEVVLASPMAGRALRRLCEEAAPQ